MSRWVDGVNPAATAVRVVDFPGSGSHLGGSTALRFRMSRPRFPIDPTQNELAWNSFAHTEFFDDNGQTVQLPATEPIKTGVAWCTAIDGDKGGHGIGRDGPFGFAYRCTVTPEDA